MTQHMKIPGFRSRERCRESALAAERKLFAGGWLHGTIVRVDPARELLWLDAEEAKKTLSIRWAPETQFAIEGHPTSSADLRTGQTARIHCRFANYELEADNISVGRPEPSSVYGKQEEQHSDR
ncbi:MAG TPA: hypothetical protein VK850_02725 [Candidatus Binatia bacterium]|nr:hypothetical protein [Candidatus Binatia bacterium]